MRTSLLSGAVGAFLLSSCRCFGQASEFESLHRERCMLPKAFGMICCMAHTCTATPAQNSNRTMETAQFFPQYKSERAKIRYGPFTAPAMSVNNGMKSYVVDVAQKPCTDCLVTWILAGLEYPNGTVANANTGLWLHHAVFSNTQRTGIVCPQSSIGDQFFASGNERTPANICVNG
jgi:hypothetical protein